MDKQSLLARLRSDLREQEGLLLACEKFLNHIEGQSPQTLRHLSFGFISRAAGLQSPVESVALAEYLSNNNLDVLRKRFLLVVGGDEFEVSDEDLRRAHGEGAMYHPDTGEPVDNFEQRVMLYFVPGGAVQEFLGHAD